MSANMGMTAISWNSNTENAARPPGVVSSFFSWNVCKTIAVDDSDRTRPTVNATCHGSLEPQVDAFGLCRQREGLAVVGQKGLVRGDHLFASGNGGVLDGGLGGGGR